MSNGLLTVLFVGLFWILIIISFQLSEIGDTLKEIRTLLIGSAQPAKEGK